MLRPVAPVKRIAILLALMVLGLLRAERGVAELKGRAGEPSRLFYVTNDRHGTWRFSVLGLERSAYTGVILWQSDRPLLSLPAQLPLPQVDWEGLGREAVKQFQDLIAQKKAAH